MPNLMQYLRLKNLFGQPDIVGNDLPEQGGIAGNIRPDLMAPPKLNMMGGPSSDQFGNTVFRPPDAPPMGDTTIPSPDTYDAGQRMRELYTPQTEASDRYNKLIGQYPNQNDYHPSALRRIGGAIISLGSSIGPRGNIIANPTAINSGMEFVDRPYTDKLTDWKNQIGPAQTAANLERNQNVNDRTTAYQTISQELRQQAQEAKDRNDQRKLEISENRARVYEFKAQHPGAKFDFSGPTVKIMDPIKGTVEDTGIPTGHMSKLDQMNLQQEQKLEQIHTSAAETRKTEDVKSENKGELAWSDPYEVKMPDGSTKYYQTNKVSGELRETQFPGSARKITGKDELAGQNQQLQNIQNKTQETIAAIDELIDTDKQGNVKLKPNARMAVGASRLLGAQYLPATDARTAQKKIDRVKSMLIVDLIGEMKAQSRTGATGFGQLNMKELGVLENAASKLDPSMKEEDFEAELKRIKEKLNKVLQPTSTYSTTTTTKPKSAQDYIDEARGGKNAKP